MPCLRRSGALLNIHLSQKTLLTKITHHTHCPMSPLYTGVCASNQIVYLPQPAQAPFSWDELHQTPTAVPAHVFSGDPHQRSALCKPLNWQLAANQTGSAKRGPAAVPGAFSVSKVATIPQAPRPRTLVTCASFHTSHFS